jgi:hypothetical protein
MVGEGPGKHFQKFWFETFLKVFIAHRIRYLVENEGLPAWRRCDKGAWKAIDVELSEWLKRRLRISL